MKHILFILLITLTFSSAHADAQLIERTSKSRAVIHEFMGQLKGELKSSMKASGPVKTVSVCKDIAPAIAKDLSDKTGWKVARTSLKPRNSDNMPDAWETKVLHAFEQRKQNGENVKPMAYSEIVTVNGVESFRFMKAIPTGKVCLQCHGQNISDDLVAVLDANYPNDMARDYKLGDIRGAFTITQPISK